MQQKINYHHYLIIGISLFLNLLFISCKDEGGEAPNQHKEYVYVNKLDMSIRLEVYETYSKSSQEFQLDGNESITVLVTGDPIAIPFNGTVKGDSVIVRFEGNKCTTYTRNLDAGVDSGNGVFDQTKYLIDGSTHLYEFNSNDYARSVMCE